MNAVRWASHHGLLGSLLMYMTVIGCVAPFAGNRWWQVLLVGFVLTPPVIAAGIVFVYSFAFFAEWLDTQLIDGSAPEAPTTPTGRDAPAPSS